MKKTEQEIAEITILNWDKFQDKRKDVKTAYWFKLSNRMFHNDKIQCLSNIDIILWLILLSIASENDTRLIRVSTESVMRLNRHRTRSQYYQGLESLARYGCVTYTLRQIRIEEIREEEKRKNSPTPTLLINKSECFNAKQSGADSNESFSKNLDARNAIKERIQVLASGMNMNRKNGV